MQLTYLKKRSGKGLIVLALLLAFGIPMHDVFAGLAAPPPTATHPAPTPTPAPVSTPGPAPTPTPTPTPTPAPTPTPTPDPTPSPTPGPGPAPSPAPTNPGPPAPGPTITESPREQLVDPFGNQSLPRVIGFLIKALLGLVGALFFALLVYAGFEWMTAMGDPTQVTNAKKIVYDAVVGLAVIVLSYTIVSVLLTIATQFVTRT